MKGLRLAAGLILLFAELAHSLAFATRGRALGVLASSSSSSLSGAPNPRRLQLQVRFCGA
jgi:hypothetical protein